MPSPADDIDVSLSWSEDMVWDKDGWPDEPALLGFEAEVNAVIRNYPAVVICNCGVPNLSGNQFVQGGLVTHPVVSLNNQVLSGNPLYVDPAEDRTA
jgi:hypothetical protein